MSPRRTRRTLLAACAAFGAALAAGLVLDARPVGQPASGPQGPPPAGAAAFEVAERTIPELQMALGDGRVTSRALVERYLARIEAYDRQGPVINAMISLNPQAFAQADALDAERAAGRVRGPLHGIPIVLKDNFDTADQPTSGGSLALASWVPPDDGFQVRKLREAGAVILGKTNLHELASGITTISSLGGQTRNPYDLTRNPGGSSGGTGAAVAASFAAAGMGSDTCGSIRIPASHNSLVGLRGTLGLSSRDGIIPLSHSQDIGGPLARTVTDLAIMLDATVGADPADPITQQQAVPARFRDRLTAASLDGARLALVPDLFGRGPDEQATGRIVRQAADEMRAAGAEVLEISIPDLEDLLEDTGVITFEFKFDLLDYLEGGRAPVRSLADILDRGLHHRALEESFRRRNAIRTRNSAEYQRAMARRTVAQQRILELFDRHRLDALLYPTMKQEPARIGAPQRGSNCQLSATTGFPALTLPAGFTGEGLPVGVELLGRPFTDARLLALGRAYEQAAPHRRPPFSTPPLVGGRAPAPVRFEAVATHEGASSDARPQIRARLMYNGIRSQLDYQVSVTGYDGETVLGAAIHRMDQGQDGPVVRRLLGPGTPQAVGGWTLDAAERNDLEAGRLYLVLYTRDRPLGALRAPLRLP